MNLNEIPNAVQVDPDQIAKELQEPKQHFPEAHKPAAPPLLDKEKDDNSEPSAKSEAGAGTDAEPKPDQSGEPELKQYDHSHAKENAVIVTWLLTLSVGFVLANLIDINGNVKDYEFTNEQSDKIREGWEIFFRSLKRDYHVPGILAPLFPMGMAIWAQTSVALENRKQKQAAQKLKTLSDKARPVQSVPVSSTQEPVAVVRPEPPVKTEPVKVTEPKASKAKATKPKAKKAVKKVAKSETVKDENAGS